MLKVTHASHKRISILKTLLLTAVLGLAGNFIFPAAFHATDKMAPMDSCASSCVTQQGVGPVKGEENQSVNYDQDKDPEGRTEPTYYLAFQRLYVPLKIAGRGNSEPPAPFRPPDIVAWNTSFRI